MNTFLLTLNLRIAGILLLALVVLNTLLPKHFHWKAELQKVSLLTRQVFLVHAMFIVLILLMMATLSLFFPNLLLDRSPLATLLLAALAFFWLLRLASQFLIYSPKLWRGHPFNTAMHILFSLLWLYFTATYAAALLMNK